VIGWAVPCSAYHSACSDRPLIRRNPFRRLYLRGEIRLSLYTNEGVVKANIFEGRNARVGYNAFLYFLIRPISAIIRYASSLGGDLPVQASPPLSGRFHFLADTWCLERLPVVPSHCRCRLIPLLFEHGAACAEALLILCGRASNLKALQLNGGLHCQRLIHSQHTSLLLKR
jgi:hypothetical protein